MRPIYPYRKQIQTDYEVQSPTNPILNDKIGENLKYKNTKNNSSQLGLTY
jgi:hypothetical protein